MKELLFSVTKKDFTIQTFKGSGPGGQHRNKVETAVRIIHNDSGAVGEAQSEKSQDRNKRAAFRKCVESDKFKKWINNKAKEIIEKKTLDQIVDELMKPENLKFEIKKQNKWEIDNG